jgi:hypothetical protein
MRGKRQFKVRWRGHGQDEDSWCGETDLHCEALIREYLEENDDGDKKKGVGRKRKASKKEEPEEEEEDEDETEYEVK